MGDARIHRNSLSDVTFDIYGMSSNLGNVALFIPKVAVPTANIKHTPFKGLQSIRFSLVGSERSLHMADIKQACLCSCPLVRFGYAEVFVLDRHRITPERDHFAAILNVKIVQRRSLQIGGRLGGIFPDVA